MKKMLVSIDPSINYAGYAVFNITRPKSKKLVKYGLINIGSKMKKAIYLDKAKKVYEIIKEIIYDYEADIITLEVPEFWGSAGLLARESGSVFKLTFLCGMLYSMNNVITYTPSSWKGQMPKHVTANLLQEHYPKIDFSKLDHNIADAIGIGHKHIHGEL